MSIEVSIERTHDKPISKTKCRMKTLHPGDNPTQLSEYYRKHTGRQRKTTGHNGRKRKPTGDNGLPILDRQRKTTGNNTGYRFWFARQRETKGDIARHRFCTWRLDNGRERETTHATDSEPRKPLTGRRKYIGPLQTSGLGNSIEKRSSLLAVIPL